MQKAPHIFKSMELQDVDLYCGLICMVVFLPKQLFISIKQSQVTGLICVSVWISTPWDPFYDNKKIVSSVIFSWWRSFASKVVFNEQKQTSVPRSMQATLVGLLLKPKTIVSRQICPWKFVPLGSLLLDSGEVHLLGGPYAAGRLFLYRVLHGKMKWHSQMTYSLHNEDYEKLWEMALKVIV